MLKGEINMIVMCPGCSGIDIDIVKNEFKDEKISILEMRTQIGYYLKGISKEYKQRFMKVNNKEDFIKLVGEVKSEYCT